MKLLPDKRLRKEAENRCEKQMTQLVTKAKLRFETGDGATEWDPVSHRYLFKQNVTIWREFDDIEVRVGPRGEILTFVGKNRFTLSRPGSVGMLADDEIIRIVETTGVVGPDAVVEKKRISSDSMLIVSVRQKTPWLGQIIRFIINPENKQVAAFKVIKKATI